MGIKAGIAITLSVITALGSAVALSSGIPNTCGGSAIDATSAAQLGTIDGYSGDQLVNASDITAAGTALGIDGQGQTIGIMTAMGESGLVVLDHGDAGSGVTNPDGSATTSVGLFQQQDSWGALSDRMDAYKSATLFFDRLQKVDGWQSMTPTAAAHAVQQNADPNFYTPYFTKASAVFAAIEGASADCSSRAAGNDYPWANRPVGTVSPLGYYYRECVDFVAWRLNRDAGVVNAPWKYTWSKLTPLGGDAVQWKADWIYNGWQTSHTPVQGSVAWWGTIAGANGHVAYVQAVNSDGTVTLEEYNWGGTHDYHTRVVAASSVGLFLYPPARG